MDFNLTNKQIEVLKKFFPLLGERTPRYHPSLYDLLEIDIDDVPYHQIYRYSTQTLKLKIDLHRDCSIDEKRCSQCLEIKKLTEYRKRDGRHYKGTHSICKSCVSRYEKDKRKDWRFTLLHRLQYHIWRENKKWKKPQIEILLEQILEEIGKPDKCFFDDEFCMYTVEGQNRTVEVDIGHIVSHYNGGTITDPKNVIWICRRHNWMMSHRDLKNLKYMIDSMLDKSGEIF